MISSSRPSLLDDVQHGGLVRFPGGNDRAPDRKRLHAAFFQLGNQIGGGRRRNRALFLAGWRVDQRSVFGDDLVEHRDFREDPLEVRQFASRHQDEFAAGLLQSFQRRKRLASDDPLMRQCAVIVRRQGNEIHFLSLTLLDVDGCL